MPELLPLAIALMVRWWRRRRAQYGRHARARRERRGRHEGAPEDDA